MCDGEIGVTGSCETRRGNPWCSGLGDGKEGSVVRVESDGEGSHPYLILQVHSVSEVNLGSFVLEGQPREFKSKVKGAEREGADKVCLLNTVKVTSPSPSPWIRMHLEKPVLPLRLAAGMRGMGRGQEAGGVGLTVLQ